MTGELKIELGGLLADQKMSLQKLRKAAGKVGQPEECLGSRGRGREDCG